MTDKITSIRVYQSTKDKLHALGKKDDSYDDIINMLLLEFEESITFENNK